MLLLSLKFIPSQVFVYSYFSFTDLSNPVFKISGIKSLEHFFLLFPSNFLLMAQPYTEVSKEPYERTGRRGISNEDRCVVTVV